MNEEIRIEGLLQLLQNYIGETRTPKLTQCDFFIKQIHASYDFNRPIDQRLKKEVIQHFEYMWKEKKGKELHKTIAIFNHTIQQDVLFDIYGRQMMRSHIFTKEKSFFKSLVLKMQHGIILNIGVICRVRSNQLTSTFPHF